MVASLLTCAALFVVYTKEVASLTNQDFLELVRPYAEEIKFVDKHGAVDDVRDDAVEVVQLRGGPSDELDVRSLLDVLQRDLPRSITGSCSNDQCHYCYEKTFALNLLIKTWKYNLKACVKVTYLPSDHGFRVEVTYNNKPLFNREYSLKNPDGLCYGVPGYESWGKVCVQFYNVNLKTKSMCVRLVGQIKSFELKYKLACFHIPTNTIRSQIADADFAEDFSIRDISDEEDFWIRDI